MLLKKKTRGPRHARARPPATPVLKVAGEGAGEEEGSTGVPIPGSPGVGRRRSGGATAVKAAAGKHSTPAHSGRGERKEGQGRSGGRRGRRGALL
jgi:hypothetical protein